MGRGQFVLHGFSGIAVYLAAAGALVAWFLYVKRPDIPARLLTQFGGLQSRAQNKYYFDWFNENVLARASRGLGGLLWKVGDETRHRRRHGERQRAARRQRLGRRARLAVGISVSLRVRDDRGSRRVRGRAGVAFGTTDEPCR